MVLLEAKVREVVEVFGIGARFFRSTYDGSGALAPRFLEPCRPATAQSQQEQVQVRRLRTLAGDFVRRTGAALSLAWRQGRRPPSMSSFVSSTTILYADTEGKSAAAEIAERAREKLGAGGIVPLAAAVSDIPDGALVIVVSADADGSLPRVASKLRRALAGARPATPLAGRAVAMLLLGGATCFNSSAQMRETCFGAGRKLAARRRARARSCRAARRTPRSSRSRSSSTRGSRRSESLSALAAERLKREGNAAFAAKRYDSGRAVHAGDRARRGRARERCILLSNRCASARAPAAGALADADAAARDAREAVELDGTFVRAWARLAKVELARAARPPPRAAAVHGLARCAADAGRGRSTATSSGGCSRASRARGRPRAAGARGKKKIALPRRARPAAGQPKAERV